MENIPSCRPYSLSRQLSRILVEARVKYIRQTDSPHPGEVASVRPGQSTRVRDRSTLYQALYLAQTPLDVPFLPLSTTVAEKFSQRQGNTRSPDDFQRHIVPVRIIVLERP